MVRNLSISNGTPSRPTRFWRNSTGPREVSRTADGDHQRERHHHDRRHDDHREIDDTLRADNRRRERSAAARSARPACPLLPSRTPNLSRTGSGEPIGTFHSRRHRPAAVLPSGVVVRIVREGSGADRVATTLPSDTDETGADEDGGAGDPHRRGAVGARRWQAASWGSRGSRGSRGASLSSLPAQPSGSPNQCDHSPQRPSRCTCRASSAR